MKKNKSRNIGGIGLSIVGLVAMSSFVAAAERYVRILPVGDSPASKMVVKSVSLQKTVAHEAEVKKDLLPPRYLYIHKAKDESRGPSKETKATKRLRLSLGSMSPVITAKVNGEVLRLSSSETLSANQKPYSNITLPVGSKESLIILYKQINKKNWKKPSTIVLANDVQYFPAQTVRMVNASSLPVSVKLKNKVYHFKSGEVKSVQVGVNQQVRLMAVIKGNKKQIKVCNSSIKLAKNQRMNVVFHNRISDSRRPIRVVKLPETIVKPVVREKAQAKVNSTN